MMLGRLILLSEILPCIGGIDSKVGIHLSEFLIVPGFVDLFLNSFFHPAPRDTLFGLGSSFCSFEEGSFIGGSHFGDFLSHGWCSYHWKPFLRSASLRWFENYLARIIFIHINPLLELNTMKS